MGQGMDGMNESWEPDDNAEIPRQQRNSLLPEEERLRVEADGLFKRAKKAEEKNKALSARITTLEAALAEAQRTIEVERQGWKIALRTIINEPQHASIIGNPASITRAEIDEIGASLVALAEAREDSARWAYVRKHARDFRISVRGKKRPRYSVHVSLTNYEYDTYDNIDAAIDAARGGKP